MHSTENVFDPPDTDTSFAVFQCRRGEQRLHIVCQEVSDALHVGSIILHNLAAILFDGLLPVGHHLRGGLLLDVERTEEEYRAEET